ncbi:MAG: HEAT repeat domain-containing protein [Synechococcaceae cyanobacterium]|nr:HEAT repeat domain-containing protein [Synechococcaceae cyanobacterium]
MTSSDMASAALIAAVEAAATAQDLLEASRQLAASMHPASEPAAIRCLVQVLGFNNPGAAVAAVDGLIAAGPAAVSPLLEGLDDHNYGARAWAVRALAGIGDVRGLDLLEQALARDIGPSVRRAAARGLGQLQLSSLPPSQEESLRERCLLALEQASADGEWVVRYAVAVALERLCLPLAQSDGGRSRGQLVLQQLHDTSREETLVVRQRAGLALTRLAAAPAGATA